MLPAPLVVASAERDGPTARAIEMSMLREDSTEFRWKFTERTMGVEVGYYTVQWRARGHETHETAHQRYWRVTSQCAVVALHTSTALRVGSLVGFARCLRAFSEWACSRRLVSSWGELATDDVRAYEDFLQDRDITRSTAGALLSVLRTLWELRGDLAEPIGVRAYRGYGELEKAAQRIGRPDGQTPTLPARVLLTLVDTSLQIVEDGSRIVAIADNYAALRATSSEPGPEFARLYNSSARTLLYEARLLYGACIVLVLAFLGMRKHEFAGYTVGNVREFLRDSGCDLQGRVVKTSNSPGGTHTSRPIIPELRQAIEYVVSLTNIDTASDSAPFFRPLALDEGIQRFRGKELCTNQIYKLIARVALRGTIGVKIRPHMFRRAYALFGMYRYDIYDLQRLSRVLYHNDLRSTVPYVDGPDADEFYADAQRDFARDLIYRAVLAGERFGGGFGKVLNRAACLFRSQTTVLRADQIDDWVEEFFSAEAFEIVPAPHGYCVIVGDRGRRARCSTDGVHPNRTNRIDEHCAGCKNFLLTNHTVDYWNRRLRVHRDVLASARLDVVKAVANNAIEIITKLLRSFCGRR